MKKNWYAIQAKRTMETKVNPLYLQKHIKPIKEHGQTIVIDENGKQYHLFKATKLDRVFIFRKLANLNVINLLDDTKIPSLIIRRFKPYGKHLILEDKIPGELPRPSIYYDI